MFLPYLSHRIDGSHTHFSEVPDIAWTFKSALGHKRILDYCFVPTEVCVESSNNIGGLDLGSDHRCVQSCLLLPSRIHENVKRKSNKRVNWDTYATVVESSTSDRLVTNLAGLEQHVVEVAEKCQSTKCDSGTKFWADIDLTRLREDRHQAVDPQERRRLTKEIWKLCRQELTKIPHKENSRDFGTVFRFPAHRTYPQISNQA